MNAKIATAIELPVANRMPTENKPPLLESRLDLVQHVPVRVSVTLGGAEMPVSKLLKLALGDTVTLDRTVDSPVDIRLGEKILARGTLVAVGEQFGVRITEILPE